MKNVLIIGCGDIGQRVANLCLQQDLQVFGLVRKKSGVKRFEDSNIAPLEGNLGHLESLSGLFRQCGEEAIVFYLAPTSGDGTTDHYMSNFLAAIDSDMLPAKIVQLSTTAVYGDCQGAWITEEQPVNPQTERGLRRLDAENTLRDWSKITGVPYVTLRVGGIYGEGRFPIDRLEKGLPILREEESPFTNRIHQDDLAQICVSAAENGKPGEIYNVSDGKPSTMSHYFKEVARVNGLPQPLEVSRAEAEKIMSAGMLSYLNESRKIDNKKMLKDLDIRLYYPSLKEGINK